VSRSERERRGAAHTSHLKVRAAHVGVAGDEEDLLLEADVGHEAVDVVPEELEEARALLAHGVVGAEHGGLLVEGVAVVPSKRGGVSE